MGKFKIGDRVKITKPFQEMQLVGAKAVVVALDGLDWYGLDIDGWTYGHDCGVLGEGCRSGYWVKGGVLRRPAHLRGISSHAY